MNTIRNLKTSFLFRTSSRNSRTANNHDNSDDHHGNNKHNGNSKSDDKDADGDDEAKDGENDDDNDNEDEDDDDKEKEVLPKGLIVWREGIRQAQTAAQVAMGFYVLETSIAWHKSIMKAFCQLCHCGDNEDSLLLCDG